MDKIRVIVSNANKMYTHQLCNGLNQTDSLQNFYTSLWHRPDSLWTKFLCSLPIVGKTVKYNLLKRYDTALPADKIKTYPLFEMLRQIGQRLPFLHPTEKWNLFAALKHDLYVAKNLKSTDYDIFIGYETNALKSFQTAKQQNKITILDLAQVHWKYIGYLRDKYPILRSMQEENVFEKVSAVKDEELKFVDYIFALSTFAKDTLINNGIDEKKIHVVNLGFDPSKFESKKEYDTNPDRPLQLLFAGTITRRKGIHLVLEAVKQLENVQLTIVGPMADGIEYLKRYEGEYSYFPFLHHQELAQKFREADLFVFPSYVDSWAMVVLEAMACGTPVIVTENTGSKDAVTQGGGKIIPVDDLEALKSAINYYKDNREKLEEDGRKANEVVQNYTWEHYYDRINTIISAIIH